VKKVSIKEFEKNHFVFVSFDLVTGQSRSNVDIAYNSMRSLTGLEDLNKQEEDLKEDVIFVENDVNVLKREWTDLKKNVSEKELELESLAHGGNCK
jgi:chromosome segregation ATPase